jgi:hypothetical protein
MTRFLQAIPANLRNLWEEEDGLIEWSEGIIASKDYLIDHLDLAEAYMDSVEMMRRNGPQTDRHIAIGGLFLRTFDAMSHCIRCAVSGNYSGSAMYARDLIETQFLISYLMDEPGRPETWLKADPDTVRNNYRPVKIREALDKRDGFTKNKRRDHYGMLSTLGSHPTPASLDMKRDGTRLIQSGPFRNMELMDMCIQEAAKEAVLLGTLLLKYCKSDLQDWRQINSKLSLRLQRTKEKYFTNSNLPPKGNAI